MAVKVVYTEVGILTVQPLSFPRGHQVDMVGPCFVVFMKQWMIWGRMKKKDPLGSNIFHIKHASAVHLCSA